MEKSTVLGIGLLAVVGVGAYVYLKGKKSPIVSSVPSVTPPTDDTKLLQNLGVTITPTTPTPYVKPVEGVPLLTSENIQKALLSLNIDQTRGINELASPNYIEAKRIAGNMKEIDKMSKMPFLSSNNVLNILEKYSQFYGATVKRSTGVTKQWTHLPLPTEPSPQGMLVVMTAKINSLGYKVLPNFEIEKM